MIWKLFFHIKNILLNNRDDKKLKLKKKINTFFYKFNFK